MLGKLFKYEFKSTAKVMLTLYAILIVTTLIGTLGLYATVGTANDVFDRSPLLSLLLITAIIIYILAVFAVFVVTYVYMCTHFYKTMYSAQGYLTHTLPVNPLTTFHVKLATSFVWMFLSVLLLFGSIFLLLTGASHGEIWTELSVEFRTEILREFAATGVSIGGFIFEIFVSLVFSCLSYLLWVYASASIGQLFSTNKVTASIVAGVVLYFAQQIISLIVMLIFGYFSTTGSTNVFHAVLLEVDFDNTTLVTNHSLLLTQNLYTLVIILALYATCAVIVRKHINLE